MSTVFKLSNIQEFGWDPERLAGTVKVYSPLLFGKGKWVVRTFGTRNGIYFTTKLAVCQTDEDLSKAITPAWDALLNYTTDDEVTNVELEIEFISEFYDKARDDYVRGVVRVVDDKKPLAHMEHYENNPYHTVTTIYKD